MNHDDFWSKALFDKVELQNTQIKYNKVDGVDVSCPLKAVVVSQHESQYDCQYQHSMHRLINLVPRTTEVAFAFQPPRLGFIRQ